MKSISKYILVATITLLFSCESNRYEEIEVTTTNPTYQKDIKPIIDANCIVCHSDGSPVGQFTLTTYNDVRLATEFGALIFRIDTATGIQSMPFNSPKLSKSKIDLIKLWAANGFQN